MKTTPINHLSEISACSDAVAWVKSTKCLSLESAWKKCERGDWMLWYAGKKSGSVCDERRKKLVLAACECARLALPIYEKLYPDDKRVRECIETAEKWAGNEATLEALQVSRRNCYAVAADSAYAVAYAAYAVAYAAYVAYADYAADSAGAAAAAAVAADSAIAVDSAVAADSVAAGAADSVAAYASVAAAYAAVSAGYTYSATKKKVLVECAEIVRKHYPKLPI